VGAGAARAGAVAGDPVTIEVDGVALTAESGTTVLEALDRAGRLDPDALPHFCWHPVLGTSASCRLCRVEVCDPGRLEVSDPDRGPAGAGEAPGLEAACTLPVREGLVVRTDGERTRAARRVVLELMLSRHALECPTCDASGECALQDAVFADGPLRTHAREPVPGSTGRAALGSGLVLHRARCVHCERCVRFGERVTGTADLVFEGRGDALAVGTAPGRSVDHGYALNLVDVCPVGAITRGDARPRTRPWELRSTAGLCGDCGRGCNVWIDTTGNHLVRYRPRRNDAVHRTWLCDAGRLGFAAPERPDRLRRASIRTPAGRPVEVPFDEAVAAAAERISARVAWKGAGVVAGIASAHATNEELFVFGRLLDGIGSDHRAAVVPTGEPDDLLVVAERAANARGAAALGFGPAGALLDRLRGGAFDVLVVLGHDVLDATPAGDASVFARLDALILLDTAPSPLVSAASVALPGRYLCEKRGTVTNVDGRVQRTRPARDPGFPVPAEGESLSRIGHALGLPGFAAAWDAGATSREMAAAVPAFAGCSLDEVGDAGRLLAGVTAPEAAEPEAAEGRRAADRPETSPDAHAAPPAGASVEGEGAATGRAPSRPDDDADREEDVAASAQTGETEPETSEGGPAEDEPEAAPARRAASRSGRRGARKKKAGAAAGKGTRKKKAARRRRTPRARKSDGGEPPPGSGPTSGEDEPS